MTEKGFKVLKHLINNYDCINISYVVSSRDLGIQNDYFDEIKKMCDEFDILFFQRGMSMNYPICRFRVAISWRWLLPNNEGDLIVIHDSLLPKYRGFNPLVTALLNGDREIGVTALWANEEMDSGNIICQYSRKVNYPIKISEAIEAILECYFRAISMILDFHLLNKKLPSIEQNKEKISYSLWRDNDDYKIDWKQSASQIKRMIDAVGYPYAGAFSQLDGQFLRILDSEEISNVYIVNRDPGKIFKIKNGNPIVVCGNGLLSLKVIIDKNGNIYKCKKIRLRFK